MDAGFDMDVGLEGASPPVTRQGWSFPFRARTTHTCAPFFCALRKRRLESPNPTRMSGAVPARRAFPVPVSGSRHWRLL